MKRNHQPLRHILILLSVLYCSAVFADRIIYSYDASGNRTQSQREIRLLGDGQSQEEDSQPRQEKLSLHTITIYPNPTDGKLSVEITGAESLEGASITIYGISGSIVYYDNEPEMTNDINLTICPTGMYLLIIRVEGETSMWKIIKI